MKFLKRTVLCMLLILAFSAVCDAQSAAPEFTDEEKQFILEHPVIHFGVDPEFVPYEFIDSDGEYKGIAADYIKLLSDKTGIEMVVEKNLTWDEAYEMAAEKELDFLPCVAKTSQREQYFLLSEPYIDFQRVIVVQNTNNDVKDLKDLKHKNAAVQKNSSHHNFLASLHPEITLNLYSTVEDALTAVSVGNETAYVGNLATSSYLIKEHGITNLKYIIINTENQQSLHFAVRNDWPELVGIINKGLNSITEEEKIEINNKWIGVENEVDYVLIFRIISVILFFLLLSIFWTIRLKREVSKRILIEEELRKSKQEAEVANQIKSSFLARMSHEIRTPLNAITGMAYLIKKTEVNATQTMYLDKITQASYTMLGIINDILDFSKIESGKVELERISFNLDKVLQEVINIVSFRIEEQGIEFRMSKDPQIPVNFYGDPKRIEQILINLINNAVKFTSAGEVSMAVNLAEQTEARCILEFCIKDTGIGMSKEQVDQLFTPFAQADSSINRRFGGTGLGLSIVKSLTELMDGAIEVDSALGEGSTFCIHLPIETDQSKNNDEKQQAPIINFKEIKALVLDKSATDLHLIENYLGAFGTSAELTASEIKAMELLSNPKLEEDKPFNLLIVDYETPLGGGLEFIEKIKEKSQISADLKIIMIVPLMREDIFPKIEEAGIDFGITKPIIPSILYNGILEIFKTETQEPLKTAPVMNETKDGFKNPYRTLVVEDNKTNQFIVKEILEQAGFAVSLAENGEEGANYFRDHQGEIDIILMDLHMPVLNGYEASVLIRKLDQSIPIVAMTADAITGIDEDCRRVGINYYISKPFDPEKLVDTLLLILAPQSENEDGIGTSSNDQSPINADILDMEDGLRRLGNNRDFYQMILKEYVVENKDVLKELRIAIDNQDYKEAVQIVHKNKGGSGNIGAKKLHAVAAELQKALSEQDDENVQMLYEEFDSNLRKLFLEIEKMA
ncbi:MAG: transporter substrate-binding domain-containing protein [Clostridia bacterium]|nr:transporter substrate-binding domain-containing protein [Clostridia bacterium]